MRTRHKRLIPKEEVSVALGHYRIVIILTSFIHKDPPPQDQKPSRRASLSPATLHPSKAAAVKTSIRKSKNKSVLGVAREHYTRKTDWRRGAFTKLHGQIRCLFCALHPSLQSRGTLHRLPDAAARHLRECCAYFEGSEMYARYRKTLSADGGERGGWPSKQEIVARVVKDYEKVAVAQVFCRKGKTHKKRCAELGLEPLDVEERLERHAVLYKAEECGCCPHPLFEECLAKVKEGAKKDKKDDNKNKKKRQLKQTVPGQLVRIKEEEQEDALLGLLDIPYGSASSGDEEGQEHMIKRKVVEHDEEEEEEVAALLKRRRIGDI